MFGAHGDCGRDDGAVRADLDGVRHAALHLGTRDSRTEPKRLNIINALGKAYTSIHVVGVPCGKIEVVLDPHDGCGIGNDDIEDNIRNYLERHIAPEYRERFGRFWI